MRLGLGGFIEDLQAATTREAFEAALRTLRDRLEVEHIVYHSVTGAQGQDQYAVLTYSDDWVRRYLECGYARIDPVVQGCFRRFHPVDWKALDWSPRPVRAFLGEAIEAGVGRQGFSVPIRGPNGQFALFTVSDRRSDAEWARYCAEHLADLLVIAHFSNLKALELERGTDLAAIQPLSPREKDVLSQLAQGLSRAQSADALAISEHTLRAYIESARLKLGAQNTLHAVALAIARGLIGL